MADDSIRPLPFDPSFEMVQGFLDAATDDTEWLMTSPGDYQSCAVETMLKDGSQFQQMIMFEIPVRINHTKDRKTIRLFIHPEDAEGMADTLSHTAKWLMASRRMGN